MSHYLCEREYYNVKFRSGYAEQDFRTWWSRQTPCHRDGCTTAYVKVHSTDTLTKVRLERYRKAKPDPFLDCENVRSYTCNAVLIGIIGWCSERKVRKVVNHHIQEVTETRTYKTKPTKGLKGSTISAIGKFVISYDARDYDPYEHGDVPEDDEW